MPYKGQINNPEGRNSFSGPMGQKEPEYGDVARGKELSRAAPVAPAPGMGAPQQAKRRAVSGGNQKGATARPSGPLPSAPAMMQAEQTQYAFWQAVLNDPDASPLTRQYAERALGLAA